MKIVIVKYNAGNVRSVLYALERLGVEAEVTDDVEQITGADKVIFPGVGEAASAMKYLRERKLDQVIRDLTQPVLGVCLGMQLLCAHSEENDTGCLGVFDLSVKKFPPDAGKVPQIGWNDIYDLSSPMFNGVSEHALVYFVHSYYVEKSNETVATARYGLEYSAAIRKDNFCAVQFHPEKSAEAGGQILSDFIRKV
jgi:glutamine amidotransferase